ncbi:hypothetical protein [Micromonospora sp. RL09-050-HVF-A]|uniref:hypothetical protein n=1 Tax=Micromonospora sp. RL09-050-HVF-A TaxID=1703433 RepID=UPI001C5FE5DB|nr:hypothetical protein [Micromonospora sp. RL09-050-HVF-A]MBW4704409.1 hypothetical protein [Micromonospora sp. RL09-050-HVF-A]
MAEIVSYPDPLPQLATPGERLGWIFNDRNLYLRRYPEPPPPPRRVPTHLYERLMRAERWATKGILISICVGFGLAGLLVCCGGVVSMGSAGSDDDGGGWVYSFLATLVSIGGIGGAVIAGMAPLIARSSIETARQQAQHEYHQAYAAWDGRRRRHDMQQRRKVDAMCEWSAVTPAASTRRVDIIGGTMYGWEAVLTVFGGSLLATRGGMTLVDFTGEALCGELMQLGVTTDRTVQEYRLPSQLAQLDLVGGLKPDELVDCLVEAMYGDAQGPSRADRSQDSMLLRELCGVLAPNLGMARLLAALRVLTDRPVQDALTPQETARLLDLRSGGSRRQMYQQLRRIEALLHPLEVMGAEPGDAGNADLTCLIADSGGRNAQNELLKDLLVQWLARRVLRESAPTGSLVIIGADEVHHRSIEMLSTLCERRGIRLVLFFGHLREESLRTIGGGEVALMRLGNHQEATQAADFIGKGHRFVLSQLTRTLGGNDTHTLADTYSESETEGGSSATSRSALTFSSQRGANWSKTRNWSQTESLAKGTNWSDARSVQRVYEYTVEPQVLQDLPEYAMILVKAEGRCSVVQAVEVDPAIITLPRVSMTPVELEPLPDAVEAVIPASRQPSQVTVSWPQPLAARRTSPHQIAGQVLPGWGAAPANQPQQVYGPQPRRGPWGEPR